MEAATQGPSQPQRIEWRRAWHSLRRVVADPDRTLEVFELIDAVSGPRFDRWYARFKCRPESARLLIIPTTRTATTSATACATPTICGTS